MHALTVYCSSSTHLDPDFHAPAKAVGVEMARRGITLVYGGGGIGLMGEVARTIKDHGGNAVGVITQTLFDREQGYDGCDELIIVDTMRQRKQVMMERGDGFLALPGGVGTFEEFFEVVAARIVGEHQKPIGILNTGGYYDPMIEMIKHGIEHRFIKPAVLSELMTFDDDPTRLLKALINAEQFTLDQDRFMPMGPRPRK